jgi:hypothetical protein
MRSPRLAARHRPAGKTALPVTAQARSGPAEAMAEPAGVTVGATCAVRTCRRSGKGLHRTVKQAPWPVHPDCPPCPSICPGGARRRTTQPGRPVSVGQAAENVPTAWTLGWNTEDPSAGPVRSGRGHRPGPVLRVPEAHRGPKPPAGASPPPGRAMACRYYRTCLSVGHRPAGAGKRSAFPGPVRRGESTAAASMAGAIAPATAPR